ncbi:DUF4249 domain-containing protein [Ekhidna sp. To15]|uniref:DUF4249 domain-containing protein n=1 Tax=Ekhidna sp. To15 TaxID=3395267 RepID=UPI003F52769B
MKRLIYILIPLIIACEEVVIIELPLSQNLIVVQGWITDSLGNQSIRLIRSNGFSDNTQVQPVETAQVIVQSRNGEVFSYSYRADGYYDADVPYRGSSGTEYRVRIVIDTTEIRSEWDKMPNSVSIANLQIDSFEENDPNNNNQQITVFYPKVRTRDPSDEENYYRWIFFKNGDRLNEPESITIQNDRLFNGNLIPNDFQQFGYESGDEMTVQLQSISSSSHDYLALLKSQVTTLGTTSGTTPAIVTGNLSYVDANAPLVLGYFGTVSSSEGSLNVP